MRIACFALATLVASTTVAQMPADDQGQQETEAQHNASDSMDVQQRPRRFLPLHRHPTLLSMLRRNNEIRRRLGLMPHRIHPALTQAAQDHANYMAQTGDFQHYSNGGPQSRAYKYGFRGFVRENIAYNYRTVEDAFSVWQGSSGHYASIVSGTTEAGFGYAIGRNGAVYYVGVYGNAAQGDGIGEDEATALKLAAEEASKNSTEAAAEASDEKAAGESQVVPAAAEEAAPAEGTPAVETPAAEGANTGETAQNQPQPQNQQVVPTYYYNNYNRGRGLFRRRR